MLKLEIKLDEEKINREQKYSAISIYQTLELVFSKYHLRKERKLDGTVVFWGTDIRRIMEHSGVLLPL